MSLEMQTKMADCPAIISADLNSSGDIQLTNDVPAWQIPPPFVDAMKETYIPPRMLTQLNAAQSDLIELNAYPKIAKTKKQGKIPPARTQISEFIQKFRDQLIDDTVAISKTSSPRNLLNSTKKRVPSTAVCDNIDQALQDENSDQESAKYNHEVSQKDSELSSENLVTNPIQSGNLGLNENNETIYSSSPSSISTPASIKSTLNSENIQQLELMTGIVNEGSMNQGTKISQVSEPQVLDPSQDNVKKNTHETNQEFTNQVAKDNQQFSAEAEFRTYIPLPQRVASTVVNETVSTQKDISGKNQVHLESSYPLNGQSEYCQMKKTTEESITSPCKLPDLLWEKFQENKEKLLEELQIYANQNSHILIKKMDDTFAAAIYHLYNSMDLNKKLQEEFIKRKEQENKSKHLDNVQLLNLIDERLQKWCTQKNEKLAENQMSNSLQLNIIETMVEQTMDKHKTKSKEHDTILKSLQTQLQDLAKDRNKIFQELKIQTDKTNKLEMHLAALKDINNELACSLDIQNSSVKTHHFNPSLPDESLNKCNCINTKIPISDDVVPITGETLPKEIFPFEAGNEQIQKRKQTTVLQQLKKPNLSYREVAMDFTNNSTKKKQFFPLPSRSKPQEPSNSSFVKHVTESRRVYFNSKYRSNSPSRTDPSLNNNQHNSRNASLRNPDNLSDNHSHKILPTFQPNQNKQTNFDHKSNESQQQLENCFVLIIDSKTHAMQAKEVRNDFIKLVPSHVVPLMNKAIHLKLTRKNRIIFYFESDQQCTEFGNKINAVEDILQLFNVIIPSVKKRSIAIFGVNETITDQELHHALNRSINANINIYSSRAFAFSNGKCTWMVSTDLQYCNMILQLDKLFIKGQLCSVRPYILPRRCARCWTLGHFAQVCEEQLYCAKCGANGHAAPDCIATYISCINCRDSELPNTNHYANSNSCPLYKNYIASLRQKAYSASNQ